MVFQIGRTSMLPVFFLTGVIIIFVPVQGLRDIPVPISQWESINSLAELAVWESLGISDADFHADDEFVTSLGLGPPPDYNTVKFVLYNRANRPNNTEIFANPDSLKNVLNPNVPTKVFVPGYRNTLDSEVPVLMRNAYLNHSDYNMIIVDWTHLAVTRNYVAARSHAVGVANLIALLLNALADSKISAPKDQHIIGHSLGAQIAGLAAGRAESKPGRCTGLDPAGPLFQMATDEGRIDSTDADLVDIIHTAASFWGFPGPAGHIDFYPNGGVWPQPGCKVDIEGRCSHAMSAKLFAHTIGNPNAFIGTLCQTHSIVRGVCPPSTDSATMGEFLQFRTPGMYYLEAILPS